MIRSWHSPRKYHGIAYAIVGSIPVQSDFFLDRQVREGLEPGVFSSDWLKNKMQSDEVDFTADEIGHSLSWNKVVGLSL